MGNRPTIEQRFAAGTDAKNNSKSSKPSSTAPSSSAAGTTTGGSSTDNGAYSSGPTLSSGTESNVAEDTRLHYNKEQVRRAIAEYNAAALRAEYNRLETGWDSEVSTVSRSEMTTSDQSKLPSPLTDQSTPFRVPLQKSITNAKGAQTTTTGEAAPGSSEPSPSPLSSTDTWYGLPSLIETEEMSELVIIEAFARPGPDDEKWVAHTHDYFDNEQVYVRRPSKPSVARRLRIGKLQRKRWSAIMREMAVRHPLPINPAPFPLSKAMDELKLRPEKRFTMPHN
ncbi:hypothetical protein GCK32_005082 [Trichostrongylus colubriformis]|uniref:Uncharacterized protein n=1 Tax=Trichostrongylus colubriformis TaxID=6319 RepID=A0AAN8EZ22_TRICO